MVFDGLRRSLRNTFRRKSKYVDNVDTSKLLPCKIVLLDGTDISINLQKDALGKDLYKRVYLHLDLVEKDYFALQFMDAKQVPHWLDPTKKVKRQVQIGPPFTFHFRVKFYALEPHNLHEELTRYHFFLQTKQDLRTGKLIPTAKQSIELGALAVQAELGDFDNTIHCGNYISEFRLFPNQEPDLERSIEKKHRQFIGMNPAECEIKYLTIINKLQYYGMDRHIVKGEDGKECTVGVTPNGVYIMKGEQQIGYHVWNTITNITFKQSRFFLCARNSDESAEYRFELLHPRAAKHLWKCSIDYHTFYRLAQPVAAPQRKNSLGARFGSRFRYSGRTLSQATKDDSANARHSMMFKRTRSERFAQRSTIGYIRIGSHVWARAINGDYYKGIVTALAEKVHIKFDNGDTISHERNDDTCLVYDMNPNPNELKIGTRVIAHWSGLQAYLAGKVSKIEGSKYHVLYDDGDRGSNSIDQIRILKPPLFFGPGSGRSNLQKKYSMKATALIGSTSSADPQPAETRGGGEDDAFRKPSTNSRSASSSSQGNGKREQKTPRGSQELLTDEGWKIEVSKTEKKKSRSRDNNNTNSSRSDRGKREKSRYPKTGEDYQITDL